MSHLPAEHPDTLEYLRSGGFSVQIAEDNPSGRIAVDQTCEETVNKYTQTSGGTKGFSLRPNAVSKFCSLQFLLTLRLAISNSRSVEETRGAR